MDRSVEVPISIFSERIGDSVDLKWRREDNHSSAPILTFQSPNREVFNLVFTIQRNEVSLEFPENPLDAFWVAKDRAPEERSHERDFEPLSVSNDRRRLTVLNINRDPAHYYFAINFESDLGPIRLVTG